MGVTTAGQLLDIYSVRLRMNDDGITTWTPAMRASVEGLVERLKVINPDETVEIDATISHDPMGRFIRVATGEAPARWRLLI